MGVRWHVQLLAAFCAICSVWSPSNACRIIAFVGELEVSGKGLLLDPSNNLPRLAYAPPVLPALDASECYCAHQSTLRNAETNKDGWGVGWYEEGNRYPLRYRSGMSIVDGHDNTTSPEFISVLEGAQVALGTSQVEQHMGEYSHSQGMLGSAFNLTVDRCGPESKRHMKQSLNSKALFGHVRMATPGGEISPANSHPFVFNNFLFMHNGALHNFDMYSSSLRKKLRPSVRGLLNGRVDSEHAGALFVNNLEGFPSRIDYSMSELRGAMRTTIAELRAMSAEASIHLLEVKRLALGVSENASQGVSSNPWGPSSMNFAVTDGTGLVVTRFRSSKHQDPPSLYYKLGVSEKYRNTKASSEHLVWQGATTGLQGVIVASEPLECSLPDLSAWRLLGKDKMLTFHPSEGVRVECLSEQCTPDLPADFGAVQEAT